jgi:hypothetical protein
MMPQKNEMMQPESPVDKAGEGIFRFDRPI